MTMNELELTFKEPSSSRGRHRHRRAASPDQRKPKGRGGRSLVALTIVLLLLGGLIGGGWYGLTKLQVMFHTPDYATGGTTPVTIEVLPGQSGADIADTLLQEDIIKSVKAFIDACNINPQCANIQPGFYELRLQMRASDAVALLVSPDSRLVDRVTVPEGLSIFRTYEVLSDALDIPVEEFEAAADPVARGVPEWWFSRNDDRDSAETIEGFLYPDTYEFGPDATAESVIDTMVGRFLSVTGEFDFAETVERDLNISPYEALIVASLSQAEAGTVDDLPKVARVTYNRVFRDNPELPCACLEYDVTTNYWLETQGKDPVHSGQMSIEMMTDPDNPYNTKDQPGLPLGPINSPGKAALSAAMDPADGDWFYFVALTDGGDSAFAETYAEHLENIQQACANGVPIC